MMPGEVKSVAQVFLRDITWASRSATRHHCDNIAVSVSERRIYVPTKLAAFARLLLDQDAIADK